MSTLTVILCRGCMYFVAEPLPAHISVFFFFNDTATTEIYTLSLHDALPIFVTGRLLDGDGRPVRDSLVEIWQANAGRSEEHTSELQSPCNLVCRLLLEKKKNPTHDKLATVSYRVSHVQSNTTRGSLGVGMYR